ncbi:TPA: hypothetical protein U1628_000207 [Streptococcus suis]|uniref:hypothetical protein n=1 Tax=Streptococcus suis TaxID=1307 RepID=UPI0002B7866A|nr:hypothetical protein [Streptococcus suis]AGF87416.1 hypothetical protein phi5218_005 [Streptococcus phage phi5218]NQO90123.1 hypothetical protein [Streptococcus suis]NQP45359.1 hypothetical protein [Streptococcus suis]HEM2799995.1 hypothetical protein [Streptococcus suis]HEM3209144.1 hypothetical protein [Streptococcus suis 22083]
MEKIETIYKIAQNALNSYRYYTESEPIKKFAANALKSYNHYMLKYFDLALEHGYKTEDELQQEFDAYLKKLG